MRISEFVAEAALRASTGDPLLLASRVEEFDVTAFTRSISAAGLTLVETSEGPVSTVTAGEDPRDLSRSDLNFDFHTDGLYLRTVPQWVVLVCENPGAGTTTTRIASGRTALASLSGHDRGVLDRLEAVYIAKNGVQHAKKLVQRHPSTGEEVVLLGSRSFLRPFYTDSGIASVPSLREVVTAGTRLLAALDSAVVHEQRWEPNGVLLFDNLEYVHGRFASNGDPHRKLLRMWLGPAR